MKKLTQDLHAFLALLISFTILCNSVMPAWAQARSSFPNGAARATISPSNSTINNIPQRLQRAVADTHFQHMQGKLSQSQMNRVLDIRSMFLNPIVNTDEQKQISDFNQFKSLYHKDIKQVYESQMNELDRQFQQSRTELENQAKEARTTLVEMALDAVPSKSSQLHNSIKNLLKDTKTSLLDRLDVLDTRYKEDAQAAMFLADFRAEEKRIVEEVQHNQSQIDSWYEAEKNKLKQWRLQVRKKDQEAFKQMQQDADQAMVELVAGVVRDLWTLKDLSVLSRDTLLETAPIILPLRTLDNKKFFSKEQRTWLLNQYISLLNKCSRDLSEPQCQLLPTALNGLGMLSSSDQVAQGIRRFLEKIYQTEMAPSLLLVGVSALLSMEQYGEVDALLRKATRTEHDLSIVDKFSFEFMVNSVANTNGQYLGEVSKFGEYALAREKTRETPLANVWEDIALILAREGSEKSLEMLRMYGVEQCRVSQEKKGSSEKKYVVRCGGIKPFLVGALVSGKSGAQAYHLKRFVSPAGQQLTSNGTIAMRSEQDVARDSRRWQELEKNYYDYAEYLNLTPAAMLARQLFLESMGDLNAESEFRIDNFLYQQVYKPELRNKMPKAEFAIEPYDRNSDVFHAKQTRQDRVEAFKIAGKIGDIGLLIWCLVDITRWVYSGGKMGYALVRISRMARNEVPVAERLAMLRRLRISTRKWYNVTHISSNIRKRLELPVMAVAPKFGVKPLTAVPPFKHTPIDPKKALNVLREGTQRAKQRFIEADPVLGRKRIYRRLLEQEVTNSALLNGLSLREARVLSGEVGSLSVDIDRTGRTLAKGFGLDPRTKELTLGNELFLSQQGISPTVIQQTQQALRAASTEAQELLTDDYLFNRGRKYKKLLKQGLLTHLPEAGLEKPDIDRMLRPMRWWWVSAPKTSAPRLELLGGRVGTGFQNLFHKSNNLSWNGLKDGLKNWKPRLTTWINTPKQSITPLMLATGLSLSSASSGLIVPLENTYGNQITETDKVLITLALPYIPSAFSAFIAPFVKKWGALNVLKTALWVSTAGLATAALSGFHGNVDEENLPSLTPLFISGTAIGVSAALSRASLNMLIKELGGGGNLLKSMMWKNAGSLFLLLPPFIYNFANPEIDFSAAFPTLGVLSLAAIGMIRVMNYDKVMIAKFGKEIGLEEGFMQFKPFVKAQPLTWGKTALQNTGIFFSEIGKDGFASFKLLGAKEVLPLVLATTAFTGFESATLNKAGNQLAKHTTQEWGIVKMMPESNRKNATSLVTTGLIVSVPFLMRWGVKPMLKALNNPFDEMTQYRRMLIGSYALNATGGALLYANGLQGENSGWGWLGLGLVGMGTANITQSFQNLAQSRVLATAAFAKKARGIENPKMLTDLQKGFKTKMMAGFSTSQLGLALVPRMVSNYSDKKIEEGVISKDKSPLVSMWIPLTSLGVSIGLAAPSLVKQIPHIYQLPKGLVAGSKAVFGSYPAAFGNTTSVLKDTQRSIGVFPTDGKWFKQPEFLRPVGFLPLPSLLQKPELKEVKLNTSTTTFPSED